MSEIYEGARSVKDSIPLGKTITLVGGSFDLLHVGHLRLLEHSKTLGDILVVCVLSDENVRSHKGPSRPIITDIYRARMVAALKCVDRAFVSHIDTSDYETLSIIQPDNVIFGIEDTERRRRVAEDRELFLQSNFPNVKIHYLERFSDLVISTSDIVRKIVKSYES